MLLLCIDVTGPSKDKAQEVLNCIGYNHKRDKDSKMARKKIDYKKMTLDQLADLHDADDEEIEEDEAFNSDDEREFGQYFDKQDDSNVESILRNKSYLGLKVPLSGDEESSVQTTEVKKGQKMILSSVCLDVPSGEFRQIKLMVRCIYLGGTDEPWLCLGNFLGQKHGGMGVPPSLPITLEAIGPCRVEWKVEGKIPSSFATSGINVFGKIVPIFQEVFSDDDISVDYAGAFMSEDEEENVDVEEQQQQEEEVISTAKDTNASVDKKDDDASKSKKRKLSMDANDTEANEVEPKTAEKSSDNNKLTKKQRKQLAKEKAQQLEDTLAASRKEDEESKSSKKKKKKNKNKKKNPTETEELSRPTSLTRERRLPSGVTVRDLLVGTGAPVKSGKKLSLHYTGSLVSTGKVFDKNHSKQHPLVFRQGTGEVIRGLERGLEGMKVGGERVISIPSKLGYGTKGAGVDIPPDSDLSFEVKLLKVG